MPGAHSQITTRSDSGHAPPAAPRIGLVLGGGGAVGIAYLAGVLEGIRAATGWTPMDAALTIGTSAGSFVGALQTSGVPPWLMYERQSGDLPDDVADAAEIIARIDEGEARADDAVPAGVGETAAAARARRAGRRFDLAFPSARTLPRLALSSPAAVGKGVVSPWRRPLVTTVAGLLGEGFVPTHEIGAFIARARPTGWADRPFWATTVNLESGERVVLGRDGAPECDLPRAVRASCAIPAYFAPVRIAGERHVDGGMWSASNLDLAADAGLDLVVCINPMSTREGRAGVRTVEGPADRLSGAVHALEARVRSGVGRGLGRERRIVEASGTPVHIVQPTAADLDVIPVNLMDGSARVGVARRALATTTAAFAPGGPLAGLGTILRATVTA